MLCVMHSFGICRLITDLKCPRTVFALNRFRFHVNHVQGI